MPAALEACVAKVIAKGHDQKSAWAICRSSMDMAMKANGGKDPTEDELDTYMERSLKAMALDTFDISGVEVFAAGTWNGDKYTVQDLQDMVAAFRETKDKIKPFLKLGHGNEQSLLRSDELPSAGWINNLYIEGKKLKADFTRIPKKIYDLIKAGAYKTVSAEIFWNINILGKTFRRMLKGVALLGSELRAVTDLNDILALYSELEAVNARAYGENEKPSTYSIPKTEIEKLLEESDMTPEELKKMQSDLSDANAKLAEYKQSSETSKAELKTLTDKIAKMSGELKTQRDENRRLKINTQLEKYIAEKQIMPAQKDALFTVLFALPEPAEGEKYKVGDKEYASLEEVISLFVSTGQKVSLSTGDQSEHGKQKQAQDAEVARINEYAEKHKVSFREAMIALSADDKAAKA